MKYDLIVCGAGPAGAMAAATAAQAGMRVLLLEKERLPRYKTCGGGMPMVAGELLPEFPAGTVVEAEVRRMRHTWQFGKAFLADINPPGTERDITLWMVQRSRFDHALSQRAAALGAEVRDGLAVRAVETDRTGVTVRAGQPGNESALVATAPHLVGADGAAGISAKAAGLRLKRQVAAAVEIEHPHRWGDGHPDLRPDVLHLEYSVRYGYAWTFPKGDHLSVGAAAFQEDRRRTGTPLGPALKEKVFRYLDALQVPYSREAIRFHAHPIPVWSGRERLHSRDNRILLAGDAAGLVNPLFGDGILHAMRSGVIAAECVAEGVPGQHTRRVHAYCGGQFTAARQLARITYEWAEVLFDRAICRPRATHVAASILCGEALTPSLMGMLLSRFRGALREGGVPFSAEGTQGT